MERAIIGAGGFAREFIAQMGISVFKFVEDNYFKPNDDLILPLSLFDNLKYKVVVAIGESLVRKRIIDSLPNDTQYFTFIHSSVQILDKDIYIDFGSIICTNCILTTNIKIGKHCQLNLGTTIGHDCVIGDYFTTAPGVNLSGNCTIGDNVYIGTNAAIKEKINICSNVTIGMGSVVIKDIIEPGTYVGIPAKKIIKM